MNITYYIKRSCEEIVYHFMYLYKLINLKKYNLSLTEEYNDVNSLESDINNFIIHNNKWGTFKITDKYKHQYKQKINRNGWFFETPYKNYGVIGYPAILFQENPIKISNINNFSVEYSSSLDIEKYKKFNTSFDLWICNSEDFLFPNVQQEIMIWDNYYVSKPFGKFREEIMIGDSLYRVYDGYIDKSDEIDLNTDGWIYICLLKVDRVQNNKIDIHEIFKYLLSKKLIDNNSYLNRSEFGNEVYNASGKFRINNFNYKLNN